MAAETELRFRLPEERAKSVDVRIVAGDAGHAALEERKAPHGHGGDDVDLVLRRCLPVGMAGKAERGRFLLQRSGAARCGIDMADRANLL